MKNFKGLFFVLFCAVVMLAGQACRKETGVQKAEAANTKKLKTNSYGGYADVVFISNPTTIYIDWINNYDSIRIYHMNDSLNIKVHISATYGGNATLAGLNEVILASGAQAAAGYTLQSAYYNIGSHHSYIGNYIDTYHLTIDHVYDVNNVDITSQVLIIPAEGIDAHVQGNVAVTDSTKCPGCGGHQPGGN